MSKRFTRTGLQTRDETALFIAEDSPTKAIEYLTTVDDVFFGLPDWVNYKRASDQLPEYVKEMPVKGFRGYTLRVMRHTDGVTYLLSAHRPGLPDDRKDEMTQSGLSEL